MNIAERAHIWAFSEGGARGNEGIEAEVLNQLGNLMLVCHGCHKTIDKDKKGKRYSVALLQQMKQAHADRVQLAASIQPEKKSLPVLFSSRIGDIQPHINTQAAYRAMFPDFYPAREHPIRLGLQVAPFEDDDSSYWLAHSQALEKGFQNDLAPLIEQGAAPHLSIFGIAPQPLLIQFGSMLCDIPNIRVYQKHREPGTWAWQQDDSSIEYRVDEPEGDGETVALNLSLSATINNERIEAVIGADATIWTLTIDEPHNDFLQTEQQLVEFRRCFRQLFNAIKAKHPNAKQLLIFPAAPAAINIEIGRVWMPKADLDLSIYDQNKRRGGFAHALAISRS